MNRERNANALLVELFIVTLFFILASLILVNVFSAIHDYSVEADITTRALPEAQNVADLVYASDDVPALMETIGFEQTETGWTRAAEDYTLTVESREAEGLTESVVRVVYNEETRIELSCSRCAEGGE